MFNNKPGVKAPSTHVDTLIGSATRIKGNVSFSGGLHVDGNIVGHVIGDEDGKTSLALSEQGNIKGEVRVPHILVNGKVEGDIYASERVELASNARVDGNVYYNRMQLNEGAEINGQLIHRSADQISKAKSASATAAKLAPKKEASQQAQKSAGIQKAGPQAA